MEESRWKKHVTWDDPDEIEAKYEELSNKVDNYLYPLTISEIMPSETTEKKIGDTLRKELEEISSGQLRTPSKSLQKRHEKLVEEMKDVRSQCADLNWLDVITDPDTRSFLGQYFPKSSKISTTDFLAFLEFEFPHYLCNAVKEEITSLLALEKKSGCISINALELLTRGQGLEDFVKQIFIQVDEGVKEEKELINNEILQEVTEIKEMLDLKSLELDKREARILARENKILRLENNLMSEFQEKLEKMSMQAKEKVSKEISIQMKRMQGLERNLSDMIKLARSKQQVLTRSELSLKASGSENASGKFKSRIAGLEKSNECLKTKLSILELESKSDKITITKLSDELQRLKARSSMLEQSLASSKRPEPEKPIEVPVILKVEPKEKMIFTCEIALVLSITSTLISCCRLTLPVLHAPSSPRSITIKPSVFEEFNDSSIGEVFFPAFNILVPSLTEAIPYVYKLKKREEQANIVKFMWEIIYYAWSEEMPTCNERKFYPNNLPFSPNTPFWKQKILSEKQKTSKRPVYQVFANLSVHKILGFYYLKWLNWKNFSETGVFAAFLLLLTSTSKKRLMSALCFLKEIPTETFVEGDIKGGIPVLVSLLESQDEISGISCEILLAISVDHIETVVSQCCCENTTGTIIEACKKTLINGLKSGSVSDLEEGLVVLLQKLSGQEYVQGVIKAHGLKDLLHQRAQSVSTNVFFQNNVNSILRNLSN